MSSRVRTDQGRESPWAAAPAEASATFGRSAARLFRRLRAHRWAVTLIILLGVGSVAPMVAGPRVLGHATDLIVAGAIGSRLPSDLGLGEIVAQQRGAGNDQLADMLARTQLVPGAGIDFDRLGMVLLLALGLFAGANVLAWLQGYALCGVVQRVVRQIRTEVEEKMHRLPLSYLADQPRGDVLSRAANDIDNIGQSLQQTLSQLLAGLLMVVGVVVMMFVVSPVLALVALVAVPVSAIISRYIGQRAQPHFLALWRHTGKLNTLIEETFTGRDLVRVFGRRRDIETEFAATSTAVLRASSGAGFMTGVMMPAMIFVGNLGYVVVAVVGALRVAAGAITIGDVQAFLQYSSQLNQPLGQAASAVNLLRSAVASAERVFELLDAPEQPADAVDPARLPRPTGRVTLDGVGFRYQPEQPLIEDLSLRVESGQTVAIVGATGAGKTTLVNLLMRFYELDRGRIALDGTDITTLRRAELRRHIGIVPQDAWLFNGTIRENVAYGRPGATEAEIVAASRAAFVDRLANRLPGGYDAVIDEDGDNISAGEKQLITIARAFLADPAFLVLDEATSSVDSRTEVLVQRAMSAVRSGRTSFLIAHRLATIRGADLIVVLDNGQIVEQGTHDELLATGGAYTRLYEAQFAAAGVAPAPRVPTTRRP